jgi:histidyl-tRNA synthetase
MTSLQPARGTRDLIGDQALRFEIIQAVSFGISKLYGFERIDTPIFEHTGVFKRAVGETTDIVGKEMYTFNDRGGEEITLRPEGTAPVVRAVISNGLTQKLPLKFSYFGPMFRYERPQKGRYRQFSQFGIELFGVDNPCADVEVIAIGVQILQELQIKSVLNINTLGDSESRNAYKSALIDYFLKYENELSGDSKNRLRNNPLRILDSKDLNDQKISESAPKGDQFLTTSAATFFAKVCEGLRAIGIEYIKNDKLVRGLDYYTHTAFEFKSTDLGAQDALGGGGRYDGLVEHMGGPHIPGVGLGMGVDRLALVMQQAISKLSPIAIISIGDYFTQALEIAHKLRANYQTVEIIYKNNPGKAFKEADRLNVRYAVVIGENEVKNGVLKLKDLSLAIDHPLKERSLNFEELLGIVNAKF